MIIASVRHVACVWLVLAPTAAIGRLTSADRCYYHPQWRWATWHQMTVAIIENMACTQLLLAPIVATGILTSVAHRYWLLTRTPQSLHHLERTPLGSMGDPSGNCTITLITPSSILFKDRNPLFCFWGLGSCSSVAIVVSSRGGNKFWTLWCGGGF
jgi:hypothetical protein